jgi:hypothetical protein
MLRYTVQALCGEMLAVNAANILRCSWSDALHLGVQKQLDIAAAVRATSERELADTSNSSSGSSNSNSSSSSSSSSGDTSRPVSSSPAAAAAATADAVTQNEATEAIAASTDAAAVAADTVTAVELGVQQLKSAVGSEVAFLGTGSAQPSKYRNVSAIYLRLGDAGLNAGKLVQYLAHI